MGEYIIAKVWNIEHIWPVSMQK